jgi:hypothetical protein
VTTAVGTACLRSTSHLSFAREGVAVHHLQFETTVAVVTGFVLVVGVALIGLLQVANF